MNIQEEQEVRPIERSIDRDVLRKHLSRLASRRGMSLVEVMVVIAIILMLMGVVTVGVMSGLSNAQQDTTKMSMGRIAQQIDIYMLRHNNRVPTSLSEVFTEEDVPRDAWNNEIKLDSGGSGKTKYDLTSYGADGQAGGEGKNADLKWSEMKIGQ
jgi:general secretion pathway protein G